MNSWLDNFLLKAKVILYFIVIGWAVYIYKKLRDGRLAKKEVLIKNMELQDEKISHDIDNSSLNDLVDKANKRNGL